MTGSMIRQRLRAGQRVYGTQIASLMNPVAARLATEMDLDFAFFCTEHVPLDRGEISMMCQFYAAHDISPIVRVPSPDATAISMALDAGAQGIVVPYVETEQQVRAAAGALKYRPIKGELLERAMTGEPLPEKTQRFLAEFNREHYLIIGIESVPAIDRLEALVTAADVDAVFLGPHDIAVSMGLPDDYTHPRFLQLIEEVVHRCRACSVGVGLHINLLALGEGALERLLDAGMNWIIHSADIRVMCQAMNTQLRHIRSLAVKRADTTQPADNTTDRAHVQTCY